MARNSSRNNARLIVFVVALIIFAYQQWEKSKQPPTKSTPQPTPKSSTRNTPRPQNNAPSSNPDAGNSNDGNLLLGNVTSAGTSPDNYLIQRDQYSMSYNRTKGGPNWVAWHTDTSNLGDLERGKFRPDPDLPRDWQITPTDYKNSGFDRGHVCPSGDRTSNREDNNATFYMSNMLPQTAELNQHVWADLENWVRAQARDGNEIYQIAGGSGTSGTIDGGKINIPKVCWKVILILPEGKNDKSRINSSTRVVAVGIPNVTDKKLESADWRDYIVPASKIESAAKVDLFSALPPNVQKALESQVDSRLEDAFAPGVRCRGHNDT